MDEIILKYLNEYADRLIGDEWFILRDKDGKDHLFLSPSLRNKEK